MKKQSGIYKITNSVNNKIYIGSSLNMRDRRYLHLSMLKNNTHHSPILQRAIDKYKIENFKFIVIEYCNVKDYHTNKKPLTIEQKESKC